MTDDGNADDRNSDHAVRGSKWLAQQFYFACVLFDDGGYFFAPPPPFFISERAHTLQSSCTQALFLKFLPQGGSRRSKNNERRSEHDPKSLF